MVVRTLLLSMTALTTLALSTPTPAHAAGGYSMPAQSASGGQNGGGFGSHFTKNMAFNKNVTVNNESFVNKLISMLRKIVRENLRGHFILNVSHLL